MVGPVYEQHKGHFGLYLGQRNSGFYFKKQMMICIF